MQTIRRYERVEGSSLTINLPEEFRGRDVEVVVLVVDTADKASTTPVEADPRYSAFLLPKPVLSDGARKVSERQAAGIPDPAFRLDDPFSPVVSEDDFDLDFPAPQAP
jgi:hypothetical protein